MTSMLFCHQRYETVLLIYSKLAASIIQVVLKRQDAHSTQETEVSPLKMICLTCAKYDQAVIFFSSTVTTE